MRKALLTTAALSLVCISGSAIAGFEFEAAPEPLPPAAPMEHAPQGYGSMDSVPVEPVESQALTPLSGQMQPPVDVPAQTVNLGPLVINPYPAQTAPVQDDEAMLLQEMTGVPVQRSNVTPMPNPPGDVRQKHIASMPVPRETAPKRNFAEVQGFGRDLPLVIALSQVVPPNYTYAFTSQDDAGATASWQGGRSWDQVLDDMLRPLDLSADIRGFRVTIKQGANDMIEPMAPPPNVVPMSPTPLPPASGKQAHQGMAPVLASPQNQGTAQTAMVSRSSDLRSSPQPGMSGAPRPIVPARVSHANSGADMMPDPVELRPVPPAVLEPVERQPMVQDFEPMEDVPSGRGEDVFMTSKADKAPPPEWESPSNLKMAHTPRYAGSLSTTRTWRAVRGDSLKTVLTDWSEMAGVELYWSSQFDYPLDSSVKMRGSFEDAVQNLLTGLRDARPRPIGRLHPNEPQGPAVLVIETQQIVE